MKLCKSFVSTTLKSHNSERTFVMATWNVNSVIRSLVLLDKEALIETILSVLAVLDAWKDILTAVFETVNSLKDGRFEESSGKAEAKFQSSSADVPLLACCDCDTGCGCDTVGCAKLRRFEEGGATGT